MIAETISVGTELLLGQIVDTNAAHLANVLSSLGISLFYRTTVGDNGPRLLEALLQALSRADIVITIGGLGPTMDDITKEVAAQAIGDTLVSDDVHREWLAKLMESRQVTVVPEIFFKQALVPSNGQAIPNPTGTALGSIFQKGSQAVICLPGPPNEFIPMVKETVIPFLSKMLGTDTAIIHSRVLRIVGMGESRVEQNVRHLMQDANPTVAPYAKSGEVHLRITARAPSMAAANALIAPREAALRTRLGDAVYGTDDETLESVVVHMLMNRGIRLAAAESCSGGLISKRIIDVEDASTVFQCGIVAYSNEAKCKILAIRPETLQSCGAVSPETAQEMARGALAIGDADLAISVTGIAGPGGGSDLKPVGTVHIGLADRNGSYSEHHHFLGSRTDIAYRASQMALALVRQYLMHPNQFIAVSG